MAERLSGIALEVRQSRAFRSFAACLTEYGVEAVCDFHAHVSAGRQEHAPWATAADIRELPEHPLSPAEIARFYGSLFKAIPVVPSAVVFDTALHGYELASHNGALLAATAAPRPEACHLFPFVVVTPDSDRPLIEKWVAGGACGFKVSPRTSPAYYLASPRRTTGVELAEMMPVPLLEAASAHRLPITVHLPDTVSSAAVSPLIKRDIEGIIASYPGLKLVLAHLGLSQSPAKAADTICWIEDSGLVERVWLDTSTVTVPEALEMALESDCRLLFGTDMDFSLVERGRFVLLERKDRLAPTAVLVSTSFGAQYRKTVERRGIALDEPLLVYQLEATLEAVRRVRGRCGKSRTAERLRGLLYENAARLLS